jgi:hypothetical protein
MIQELNFRLPIFDQKVKVRVGDLNKIIKKYKIKIDPPYSAFYDVYEGCHLIVLPEDWQNYVLHETGHCAWGIVRTFGGTVEDSEEVIMYLHEYLFKYIKENL